ncbi:MAG: DMT family transporter [Desulfovibrionaceae bacterium]|nr:DMT family transporter [Desulfovibrionaceae bacterium]
MRNAFLQLHLSIILAGFTGILGKLISLPEGPLVWYRMLMASVLLLCGLGIAGKLPRLTFAEVARICGVGMLIALHWLFFYASVKYANVSIAVICFALTGFFTAICEPLFGHRRISLRDLAYSMLTVCGIACIFHFDARYRTGIILGVLCAVFAALFTIAMKRVGSKHAPSDMLLYQMIGGWILLTLISPLYLQLFPAAALVPGTRDLVYLFLLSSLCTIGMFYLQIQALKHISAFTVNLSYSLEPVYSILLAILLLDEASQMNAAFFVGLAMIAASVLLQSLAMLQQRDALQRVGK